MYFVLGHCRSEHVLSRTTVPGHVDAAPPDKSFCFYPASKGLGQRACSLLAMPAGRGARTSPCWVPSSHPERHCGAPAGCHAGAEACTCLCCAAGCCQELFLRCDLQGMYLQDLQRDSGSCNRQDVVRMCTGSAHALRFECSCAVRSRGLWKWITKKRG